jgi:hypothetical protein
LNYSDASKRSVGYEFLRAVFYEDIQYHCSVCSKAHVLTAAQQQEHYEVKKRYLDSLSKWQRLCPDCWAQRCQIKLELLHLQAYYLANKALALNDADFLNRWLSALNTYNFFSRKDNPSRRRFIEKALANLPQATIHQP